MDNNKVSKGRVVHLTAAIIILVLATVAFAITMSLSYSAIDLKTQHNATTDSGEQLGLGLSQMIVIIYLIIFGAANLILSAIGVILSATVWRYRQGKTRIIGIASTVLNSLYILAGVIVPMIAINIVNVG